MIDPEASVAGEDLPPSPALPDSRARQRERLAEDIAWLVKRWIRRGGPRSIAPPSRLGPAGPVSDERGEDGGDGPRVEPPVGPVSG
jgi:hypothetical protein